MAAGSRKVILAALVGNSLIAVTKFTAAALTGSSAMFSEGIHSVVDSGNQVLLLFGLRRSRRPPNRDFPFGHGKEIYFWSFVVAISIFGIGAGVSIYEGIHAVLDPHPIENPLINYLVLGLAVLFEGGSWWVAFREFNRFRGEESLFTAVRRAKDPTVFVVFFEDSAALLGLLVALVGVAAAQITGIHALDGISAIVIGLILAGTALWLAAETKGLLIGESARPDVVAGIRKLASNHPAVLGVNDVLTTHFGPEFVLVNLSLEFRDELSTGDVEQAVAALDRRIRRNHPDVKRVFIEAEAPILEKTP